MSKIDVNKAAELAKLTFKDDPSKLREFIEAMRDVAKKEEAEEKPPAMKKQFVFILSDPEGKLPKQDMTGWVVQIPEDASPYSTMDRIKKGAYAHNCTKRGRMLPAKSIGDSIETGSAKIFKDEGEVWIKTKLPCAVVVTDNVLPKDEITIDHRRKDEAATE